MSLLLFLSQYLGFPYFNRNRLLKSITASSVIVQHNTAIPAMEQERMFNQIRQEERDRISADLHDELGSGITAIRMMSETARRNSKEKPLPELEKISCSAGDLLVKMHAIIWSMNNGNDSLENLVAYTKNWILDYFENTKIQCLVSIPECIPECTIPGGVRRNIFLCVKESLNNIMKHSLATRVSISFQCNRNLLILISDNGCGIAWNKIKPSGNGLNNITRRMKGIGGRFHIENKSGTVSLFELPLYDKTTRQTCTGP